MIDLSKELKEASRLGISLTELRHRRAEDRRNIVDPAETAFRKALAEHLVSQGRQRRLAENERFRRP